MDEKKYLKLYNKIGYGGGDFAANMVYGLVSSFVMIYLTNTVGLNAAIIGTLTLISKLLDGVTDILFGSMIDRTHSKFGKARPWMLWSYVGNAIALVAVFNNPPFRPVWSNHSILICCWRCPVCGCFIDVKSTYRNIIYMYF